MNQRQADLFDALCKDPSTCVANAYFFARDGEGHPQIDWMCRQDLADTGTCFCGRLTDHSDGLGCAGDGHGAATEAAP